jgi:hypothetical protein
MLRNNPDLKSEISKKLNGDDILFFVNATSDNDDAISDQATELLYALKDNRQSLPGGQQAGPQQNHPGDKNFFSHTLKYHTFVLCKKSL